MFNVTLKGTCQHESLIHPIDISKHNVNLIRRTKFIFPWVVSCLIFTFGVDDNVDNIKDILLDNAIKTKGIKQMMNNFIKLVCGY